jgi:hypothetical protein
VAGTGVAVSVAAAIAWTVGMDGKVGITGVLIEPTLHASPARRTDSPPARILDRMEDIKTPLVDTVKANRDDCKPAASRQTEA